MTGVRADVLAAALLICLGAKASPMDSLVGAMMVEDFPRAVAIVRGHVTYRPRPDTTRINRPAKVWRERQGDCTEMAYLLHSAAEQARIHPNRLKYVIAKEHGVNWHIALMIDDQVLDPALVSGVWPLIRRRDLDVVEIRHATQN